MSQVYYPARPRAQESMPDSVQHRRQLAQQLNGVAKGHVDCTLAVTLDPSVATTTITDARISIMTAVLLSPMTAHAAAEIAARGLYIVPAAGAAVVHHANNAQTDRTYQCALIG
jgi:hypothetical protein